METFPVDVDPLQVVRWVRAERDIAPEAFIITATRTLEVREGSPGDPALLDDEDREDISEVATTSTLEIAPVHAADGWRLTIVVENEAAPHIPDRAEAVEPEQSIDLSAFCSELVRPGSGTTTVFAHAEDAAAKARVTALVTLIEGNYHGYTADTSPEAGARPSTRA
jgi:hypothetical protein